MRKNTDTATYTSYDTLSTCIMILGSSIAEPCTVSTFRHSYTLIKQSSSFPWLSPARFSTVHVSIGGGEGTGVETREISDPAGIRMGRRSCTWTPPWRSPALSRKRMHGHVEPSTHKHRLTGMPGVNTRVVIASGLPY